MKKQIDLHEAFTEVADIARDRRNNPIEDKASRVEDWRKKTQAVVQSVEIGANIFELEDFIEYLEHSFYFHELPEDQAGQLFFDLNAY